MAVPGINIRALQGEGGKNIEHHPPFQRALPDDKLYTPSIKQHSLEKIRLHNYFAALFTGAMAPKWPQLAYVGLYSGSGRARLDKTGEVIETTALSVLRLPKPFTKYIFVDNDDRCISALKARSSELQAIRDVSILKGDANQVVPLVREALPSFGPERGLLSFCFVDPFAADLRFETIRNLSDYRMDFLILLMLGRDIRTNLERYYRDQASTRVADLIDCPDWREQFDRATDRNIVRFVLSKFDEAMVRLKYLSAAEHLRQQINAAGTGVLQYVLVFYSKHRLGQQFWRTAIGSAPSQTSLNL
jgi:three-Cys-motif partner protein